MDAAGRHRLDLGAGADYCIRTGTGLLAAKRKIRGMGSAGAGGEVESARASHSVPECEYDIRDLSAGSAVDRSIWFWRKTKRSVNGGRAGSGAAVSHVPGVASGCSAAHV